MLKISLQRTNKKGFTLIEVLIAIFIAVTTLVFVLPQIRRTENESKNTLRDLKSLNRTLYSYSRIYNRKYRLVLKNEDDFSSYWIEVESPYRKEEIEMSSDEEPPHPFFKKDSSFMQTRRFLSDGMFFEWDEELSNTDEDIFYVLYDPHTFSPPFTIRLRKQDFIWELEFNPLLGELEIFQNES